VQILLLLTDAYGGHGGIAKFNRDLMRALARCPQVERIFAWPRLPPASPVEPIEKKVMYDWAFAGGKPKYVFKALSHAVRPIAIDLVICGHVNLLPVAWFVAKLRGSPLALVIHGVDAWTPTRNPITNWLTSRVDAVLSVSRHTLAKFCGWSRAAAEQATILPNCVDLSVFTPGEKDRELERRYGLKGAKVVMTLGRLEPRDRYKGFDEVIELLPRLAERFPDVKYLVVGGGLDRERLERKALDFDVADRVVFAGQILERQKVAHYRLADAFVMTSAGEGFGIVLIEAAACGLPVVGSNADGSQEALQGGRLGALVNPRSPDELFAAVSAALEGGLPRVRPQGIEGFSVEAFDARVAAWIDGLEIRAAGEFGGRANADEKALNAKAQIASR